MSEETKECLFHGQRACPTSDPCAKHAHLLDLDAIEKRANAATPGPWTHEGVARGNEKSVIVRPPPAYPWPVSWHYGTDSLKIADFIAHAREDVPALIARVRDLENALAGKTQFCRSCEEYARGLDRAEAERDQALARVKELEQQVKDVQSVNDQLWLARDAPDEDKIFNRTREFQGDDWP